MKKKVVITIGREFGSGGREIGEKLANKLGINFYDKNILDIAAEKSGISVDRLALEDEKAANPLLEPYIPYGIDSGSISQKLFKWQSKIILEKAQQESCVIVGRCSDIILEDEKDVIHVFIYAPMENRIERVMERYDIDDSQKVAKVIKKADKARKTYYYYYTDAIWGEKEGKDLMINSATVGVDGAVDLIIQYLKIRGYE